MKSGSLLQLFSLLAIVVGQALAQRKVVMCYYTNWSQYRVGKKFFPDQIDPNYCTHIVFAFSKVSSDDHLATYEWDDIVSYNPSSGLYYRFTQLKKKNPNLKTLLAVGGYNHGPRPFSMMTATSSSRQKFITSAIKWLRDNNFDGLDIDWEYPSAGDKQNFALLVKEMKAAFRAEGSRTGKPVLLLTAAVAAGYSKVADGYDVPALSQNLDYINLMAYDLHGAWDKKTGHNAGLFTASSDSDKYSVSAVAMNWVRLGADKSKVLVGLATYGRTWTLTNAANNAVGAPATGAGQSWPYSQTGGVIFYYEVCDALKNKGYTSVFDRQTKTPYAYSGNQWITYDNVNSLQHKMTWIIQNGFGGAIVWAIEEDDFDGTGCGQGRYPLLRVIHQCLMEGKNCAPTDGGTAPATRQPMFTTRTPYRTTAMTSITQAPFITRRPIYKSDCLYRPGLFRDWYNCDKFWVCTNWGQYQYTCRAPRSSFNPQTQMCDYPQNVNCREWIVQRSFD